jgi:hypothetical protein
MRRNRTVIVFGAVATLVLVSVSRFSSSEDTPQGLLIITQVPAREGGPAVSLGDPGQGWDGSRIVLIDLQNPEGDPQLLTADFHSAMSPDLSFDGRLVVFAGKREASDSWQIWTMSLDGSGARPVTSSEAGLEYSNPSFIAQDRVAFTGRPLSEDGESSLYTSEIDASNPTRITFEPGSASSASTLADGRLLYVDRPPGADPAAAKLMVVRSDGTANQLYYTNPPHSIIVGRAREADNQRVVLVEADRYSSRGKLVTLSTLNPLHSRLDVGTEIGGSFHSVAPVSGNPLLVSYSPSAGDVFGIYQFDLELGRLGEPVTRDPGFHAVQPVAVSRRTVPRQFVSVVDPQVETGEFYGLDADLSDLPTEFPRRSSERSHAVRVHSTAGLLGEVPLESDGSFYIRLPANTPVRLETVDAAGRVVRGPSDWIWVRPNERRGCIGCHESREIAPPNQVPRAIEQPPISLPIDTSVGLEEIRQ